jgi:hypothetical protein
MQGYLSRRHIGNLVGLSLPRTPLPYQRGVVSLLTGMHVRTSIPNTVALPSYQVKSLSRQQGGYT